MSYWCWPQSYFKNSGAGQKKVGRRQTLLRWRQPLLVGPFLRPSLPAGGSFSPHPLTLEGLRGAPACLVTSPRQEVDWQWAKGLVQSLSTCIPRKSPWDLLVCTRIFNIWFCSLSCVVDGVVSQWDGPSTLEEPRVGWQSAHTPPVTFARSHGVLGGPGDHETEGSCLM